ncbi:MAG: DUF2169 domain-containing protein [Sandaracinaceae bacterium]|nr:MAG: DUF2169 domain-containing protein [Sandaracinaceae bacterium]
MEAPAFRNRTDATALLHPVVTGTGWELLVVVKERFQVLDDGTTRRIGRAQIRFADERWDPDDPARSSTRYPHDLAPRKPTTDIVVSAEAVVPSGASSRELDVRIEVGDAVRSLRVFGPRTWYDAGTEMRPTDPLPFSRATLRWEDAFGGLDTSDPSAPLEELRNPLGRGLAKDPQLLAGAVVPHVEDPTDLIRGHRSRPQPAGVGAIGPGFEPRRSAAGTYDDVWRRHRMPLPPLDLDDHFYQAAAPGLRTRQHLVGGEPVRMLGLHRDGALSFELPRLSFLVEAPSPEGTAEHVPILDTVMLEPNARRLELTWRACLPWPSTLGRRASIHVTEVR